MAELAEPIHSFALNVLANCGGRCVFCGLNPGPFGGKRMLVAGHIKPWKDSISTERLDLRNGLAACPSHDVAFGTGLLTVDTTLQVHVSGTLAAHGLLRSARTCGWIRKARRTTGLG